MAERIAHATGLFLPQVVSEAAYERCLGDLASQIFPDYIWCDFKAEIKHPGGSVHADAALVAQDYSRWYVVEVELAWHRWTDHIQPQLSKLNNGMFYYKHKQRLLQQQPLLNPGKLEEMDIYSPQVVLIIDRATPAMQHWCRSRNILCVEAALYGSASGDIVLSVCGDVLHDLSRPEPRVVGRVIKAPYAVDVPMLMYDFPSEVSELRVPFEVELASERIVAHNFGSKSRGFTLTCTVASFAEAMGEATVFDIVKNGPSHYCLVPRR